MSAFILLHNFIIILNSNSFQALNSWTEFWNINFSGINDELRLLDSSYEVDEGKGSSVVAGNSSEPSVNSDTLDRNRLEI